MKHVCIKFNICFWKVILNNSLFVRVPSSHVLLPYLISILADKLSGNTITGKSNFASGAHNIRSSRISYTIPERDALQFAI